jgi:hypothetical protein
MNPLTNEALKHIVILLVAALLPPLVKAFNEGTQNLPTIVAKYRIAIVMVLTGIGTAFDQWQNGVNLGAAFLAVAMQAGPALVMELIHAIFGGWPPANGGAPPKAMFPGAATGVIATFAIMFGCMGCGTFMHDVKQDVRVVAGDVQAVADQATAIVATVHSIVDVYFDFNPNADNKAKVDGAFADVALGIAAAIDLAAGATEMTDQDYNAAFAQFRAAYANLAKLLHELGIVEVPTIARMAVSTKSGAKYSIPAPKAMQLRGTK